MASNSERHEAIEALLAAATLDAEGNGGDLLAAARAILEQAQAAKAERDITPYARGMRDYEQDRRMDRDWLDTASEEDAGSYSEGYGVAEQHAADCRCDQIETDFLDGLCTLSGNYHPQH